MGAIFKLLLGLVKTINRAKFARMFTKPLTRRIRHIAEYFKPGKNGKINIFRTWRNHRVAKLRNVRQNVLRHPIRALKRGVRNAAIGLAIAWGSKKILGSLFGGGGGSNSEPSMPQSAPEFSPQLQVQNQQPSRSNRNLTKAQLVQAQADSKLNLEKDIEAARAAVDASNSVIAQASRPTKSSFPDKLTEIKARSNNTSDQLTAIIDLLNRQGELTNEVRKNTYSSALNDFLKLQQDNKRENQLLASLLKLRTSQSSANNDAIKAIDDSADKIAGATLEGSNATQKALNSYKAESKKSSLLKWGLIGGILWAVNKMTQGIGGLAGIVESVGDTVFNGLKNVGEWLGILHDDSEANQELQVGRDIKDNQGSDEPEDPDNSLVDAVGSESFKEISDPEKRVESALETNLENKTTPGEVARNTAIIDDAAKWTKKGANKLSEMDQKAYERDIQRIVDADSGLKQANTAIAETDTSIKTVEDDLAKAKAQYEADPSRSNKKQVKKLQNELDKLNKTRTKLQSQADELQATFNKLDTKVTDFESKHGLESYTKKGSLGNKVTKAFNFVDDKITKVLTPAIGLKLAKKAVTKKLPLIGIGFGIYDGIKRAARGDWWGGIGSLASATVANLGEFITVASAGGGTALMLAGLAASVGIDKWVLANDIKLAKEAYNRGDLKFLLDMGIDLADIMTATYGLNESDSVPADHPMRMLLDRKYRTVNELFSDLKDPVLTLSIASQLPNNCPVRQDFDKNWADINKLLDDGYTWDEIAEIVNNSAKDSPLRAQVDEYADILAKNTWDPKINSNGKYAANVAELAMSAGNKSKLYKSLENEVAKITDSTGNPGYTGVEDYYKAVKKQSKSLTSDANQWFKEIFKNGRFTYGNLNGLEKHRGFTRNDFFGFNQENRDLTIDDINAEMSDPSNFQIPEEQPVEETPEYAEGTNYHPGGEAIVGDGGKHEVVITPDNKAHITPNHAVKVNLPAGSKVISEITPLEEGKGGTSDMSYRPNPYEFLNGSKWDIKSTMMKLNEVEGDRKSKGYCYKYVREALNAGGIPMPKLESAYMSKDHLKQFGFTEIPLDTANQTGDIYVIDPFNNHEHGHIAMFNGKSWISDFEQRGMNIYSDLPNSRMPRLVTKFRMPGIGNVGNMSGVVNPVKTTTIPTGMPDSDIATEPDELNSESSIFSTDSPEIKSIMAKVMDSFAAKYSEPKVTVASNANKKVVVEGEGEGGNEAKSKSESSDIKELATVIANKPSGNVTNYGGSTTNNTYITNNNYYSTDSSYNDEIS